MKTCRIVYLSLERHTAKDMGLPDSISVRPGAQLKEAKRRRHKEADKEKRKQRDELALIREAEAQKAHEAALAAMEASPPLTSSAPSIRQTLPPTGMDHAALTLQMSPLTGLSDGP